MDVHHLYVKLNQVVVRSITLSSGHHNRPPKNKYMMQGDISTKLCVLPMVSMSKQNKTKTLAYMSKCACGKPNSRRQCSLPSLHGDHLTINVHSLVFEHWMNSSPLSADGDTGFYAPRYYACPSVARGIAVLRADEFPYPRQRTRGD